MEMEFKIVALVATKNRYDLLKSRSLPSIHDQEIKPHLVVVVDDSPFSADRERNREAVFTTFSQSDIPAVHLKNQRTSGASGAWNTGLLHIMGIPGIQLEKTFVAILDDDDEWLPSHLRNCIEIARNSNATLVAAAFDRIESVNEYHKRITPPLQITRKDFFIGNPGVQGSNIFVRLDTLISAGLFDEALLSCTDRDLCIRLLDIEETHYAPSTVPSVLHYAELSRDRLSKPLSRTKSNGLESFFKKYSAHMSKKTLEKSLSRARRLFQWEPAPTEGELHLVIGIVADANNPGRVKPLLDQLLELSGGALIAGLDVLILENGPRTSDRPSLRSLVEKMRDEGLRCYLQTIEHQAVLAIEGAYGESFDRGHKRLPIATMRTMLQATLYTMCRKRPGCIAWVLDDDKRLDPVFDLGRELGGVDRWLVRMLRTFRTEGRDVVIGRDAGSAPLPTASTLRVQLLDIAWNLEAMAQMDPDSEWHNREEDNATLRASCPDYYYDFSGNHSNHLETPMWWISERSGTPVREAFLDLSRRATGLIRGEQITRPLKWEPELHPTRRTIPAKVRGGCTFILNIETLALFPNCSPGNWTSSWRRSDTIWMILQQNWGNVSVVSAPIFVSHDRGDHEVDGFNVHALIEDSLGHCASEVLRELAQQSDTDTGVPDFAKHNIENACEAFSTRLRSRLGMIHQSISRSRNLLQQILRLLREENTVNSPWWSKDLGCQKAASTLAKALESALSFDAVTTLQTLEIDSLNPEGVFRNFLERLNSTVCRWRSTLCDRDLLQSFLDEERVALGRQMIHRLIPQIPSTLNILGSGAESVVFSDGINVYKYLDYWKVRGSQDHRTFMRSLIDCWKNKQSLYSIKALHEQGVHGCLVYKYEPSEPYTGGQGKGLVTLLKECMDSHIVFENMHPKNLRVVGNKVKLIDYGSDIRPFSKEGFDDMCRRAYICWRYAERINLNSLLRQAITDPNAAENTGWHYLREAVTIESEDIRLRKEVYRILSEKTPSNRRLEVLDYGSGKGLMTKSSEVNNYHLTLYDPDEDIVSRLQDLDTCYNVGGLPLRKKLLKEEKKFDAIVCNRVICSIKDDSTIEEIAIDLDRFIKPDGIIIISICNPFFTTEGQTPERSRCLPESFDPYKPAAWEMQLHSGNKRIDIHRHLGHIERGMLQAGLIIDSYNFTKTIDIDSMTPQHDYLILALRPIKLPPKSVSLVIKTCAMDWETIEGQVHHLVHQLQQPRGFDRICVAVDMRTEGFPRQYTTPDIHKLNNVLERMKKHGVIDEIIPAPDSCCIQEINQNWFEKRSKATHATNGSPVTSTLNAFDYIQSDYILQVDSDLMIGRTNRLQDYIGQMIEALDTHPEAITISLPIAGQEQNIPVNQDMRGIFRVEVRGCMFHRERLLKSRPWPNQEIGHKWNQPWYRSLDQRIQSTSRLSLRGGCSGIHFIHPQNTDKSDRGNWQLIVDRVESGIDFSRQHGKVNLENNIHEWLTPKREESFIFCLQGRNISPGKVLRCLESIRCQIGHDFGIILIDDNSSQINRNFLPIALSDLSCRTTLLRPSWKRGKLANLLTAVRHVCINPEAVIVIVDLDDTLVGNQVLVELDREYKLGADLTIGSMIRTDKPCFYPVCFEDLQHHRGGNVWQHLRTFKKHLLDELPDEAFLVEGAFPEIANDWALMIPLVKKSQHPRWIKQPLYIHEPSGRGKGVERERREQIISMVMKKNYKETTL